MLGTHKSDGSPVTIKTWGRINWFAKSPLWQDRRGFRGQHDLEKPPGQWNTLECICLKNTITIRLNGTTVNKVTNVWPTQGKILLQSEGAEITFRNVTLVPKLQPTSSR